ETVGSFHVTGAQRLTRERLPAIFVNLIVVAKPQFERIQLDSIREFIHGGFRYIVSKGLARCSHRRWCVQIEPSEAISSRDVGARVSNACCRGRGLHILSKWEVPET